MLTIVLDRYDQLPVTGDVSATFVIEGPDMSTVMHTILFDDITSRSRRDGGLQYTLRHRQSGAVHTITVRPNDPDGPSCTILTGVQDIIVNSAEYLNTNTTGDGFRNSMEELKAVVAQIRASERRGALEVWNQRLSGIPGLGRQVQDFVGGRKRSARTRSSRRR
jgi:hypothetical protein